MSKRAGQWLIGVEIALALILMSGAGLILRSFARLVATDLGFDSTNVVTLEVEPLDQDASVRRTYYASLVDALRPLPEVAAAGAIDQLALDGGGSFWTSTTDSGVEFAGMQHVVLPGYLQAMNVRPTAGRLLEDSDRAAGESVVANATASKQYFGGNAVGHTLRMYGKARRQLRIVGVIPNMLHGGPQARVGPVLYVLPDPTDAQGSLRRLAVVVRLRPGSLPIEELKRTAESIGPRVLVERIQTASTMLSEEVTRPRHRMLLLTLLGSFGVLLTLVGVFSMTAYAVARRPREIGVRVAFGARPAQVVRVMLRDTLWPIAFGVAAGLAGSSYATRVITAFLFATSPHDPGTLASAVALLAAAACTAAWVPARRAASVDPMTALRTE